MEPIVVEISKSFELLARRTHDAEELSGQIALMYPDADASQIRRAAIFAMTSPTIDPEMTTRIYDVAMRLRTHLPSA
jgi:hypothetical protein